MNRRRKAQDTERRCQKELEAEGWEVERMQYSGNIYQKRKDFFGLWDIIAIKKDEIKFVQCKTNKSPNKQIWLEWAREHEGVNLSFEIWIWYEEGMAKSWSHEWRKIVL